MMSSEFPQSAIGLPSALKYELPPSLPDSARAYSVAVAPNGVTQVTGTALATPFVANSGMAQTSFNSQTIAFDIPCGQGHVFLDPKETLLNFRLTWNVTTALVGGAATKMSLISSAASFFDALTLYHNNTPIEIVQNFNLLYNLLMNSSVNQAERYGGISVSCGADTDTYTGIDLPTAAGTYYFNFCIPLISIIGLNCDKLIPVGYIQNLQLQLQTANLLPVSSYCTTIPTTAPVISAPILDQFTLNMKYIDVGDVAANLLSQTLQDGKWFIKAATYTNSNVTIPSGSNGTSSLLFQIRNSSVKSLFIQHGIAAGAVCPNGYYDAINPALTSLQASIAGSKFPNKPLNPSQRPAECFAAFMSAWGASSIKSFGGIMFRSAYGATIPALPANSDNMMVVPAAGLRAFSNSDATTNLSTSFPHMSYQGFDLERVGGSLFSGVNTRSSPPYIDVTFGVASTSTIQSYAWGLSDVVLVIDTTTKHMQAFI